MTFDELKEKALSLPLQPGVYLMMDKEGTVIYVGKAKALKNRVSQYFHDQASHTEKTRAMVAQIDHFDTIVADSEFEALVLENSLIKRHKPRYNILLKDDKGYPYIRLSVGERYPRFSIQSRMADDGARYFGPFGGRHDTQAILDALRTALKLPSCGKKFPRDQDKERPCLNFHMGQCDGYCQKAVPQAQHQQAIDQAIRLLEGKFGQVEKDLREQMEQAAEALEFEKAAALRDRLREQLSEMSGVRLISPADGSPYIVNFSVPGYRSETMLHFLESRGVFVSSGSACSKGAKSPVLLSMGLPAPVVDGALRASFIYGTSEEELDMLVSALREGIARVAHK